MNDELTCCMALHAVEGMGPVAMRRLLDHFGGARDVVERADAASVKQAASLRPEVVERVLTLKTSLPRMVELRQTLERNGMRALRFDDPEYPSGLHDLSNPPPLIYVYGTVFPEDARAAAIIGATTPSPRGRPLAEGFARRLAKAGCTVVSGYAHGIDSAAHRGALAAGGRTIFVVPHGITLFKSRWGYPPMAELARRGAVISETPPEAEWSSMAAVMRNRLIAALARAVIVIETSGRGGAMHTVRAAQQLRRPLFAIRYGKPPAQARGNELILGQGAAPLRKFADVDAVVGVIKGG